MAAGYPDFPGPVYSVADRPGLVWTQFDAYGAIVASAGDASFESLDAFQGGLGAAPFNGWPASTSANIIDRSCYLALPTPIHLYGTMRSVASSSPSAGQTAFDYALDGGSPGATWTAFGSLNTPTQADYNFGWYRNSVISLPGGGIPDVVGLRFRVSTSGGGTVSTYRLIVFGEPMTPEGLQLWHPTNNEILPGDWFEGAVMEASTDTRTVAFRVRNPTGSTVSGATVDLDIEQVPGNTLEYAFSTDGGSTWGPVASLASMAPSSIHAQILFRVTPTVGVSSLDKTDFKIRIHA